MRFYILHHALVTDRATFEAFLINYINEKQLYELRNLLGDGKAGVETHVHHHPLRLAREIWGYENVQTYVKIIKDKSH